MLVDQPTTATVYNEATLGLHVPTSGMPRDTQHRSVLNQSSTVSDALTLFPFVTLPLPTCQFSSLRRSPLAQKSSNSMCKPQRPQRRKQWTAEPMDAALHSVTHYGLSGNRAADI